MNSRMHVIGPLAAIVTLAGCGADSWYRAEQIDESYLIVRAGLDDDSCVVLFVSQSPPSSESTTNLTDITVELPDGEHGSVSAYKLDIGAEHCVEPLDWAGRWTHTMELLPTGAGTIRLRETTSESGNLRLCSVELYASVEGWFFDGTVQIDSWACPPVEGETFEVDVLGASSPNSREDFLALRSWNEDRQICYELDFYLDETPYEGDVERPLSLPDNWALRRSLMSVGVPEEDCRTGEWSWSVDDDAPPPIPLWGDEFGARGSLRFDSTQPWINPLSDIPTPCELSVDISVDFDPLYYWTPTTVRFVAENVPVAGTCGNPPDEPL